MNASDQVREVYEEAHARRADSPTLDRLDAELHVSEDVPSADGSITRAELEWIGQQLELASGRMLLDIGSGSGEAARWLAQETGCQVVGTDLMPERVRAANSRAVDSGLGGRAKFLQADSTEGLCFSAHCFDAVTLLDALVHFEDKSFVFGEIARVLAPGRRLAISTILGTQLPPEHARVLEETTGSLFRIEAKDLIQLLMRAGFSMIAQRDRTAQLERWHRHRASLLDSSLTELLPELGEVEFHELLERVQVMVELLTSGALTSALVIAEKSS